jgi:hypothetical protein
MQSLKTFKAGCSLSHTGASIHFAMQTLAVNLLPLREKKNSKYILFCSMLASATFGIVVASSFYLFVKGYILLVSLLRDLSVPSDSRR